MMDSKRRRPLTTRSLMTRRELRRDSKDEGWLRLSCPSLGTMYTAPTQTTMAMAAIAMPTGGRRDEKGTSSASPLIDVSYLSNLSRECGRVLQWEMLSRVA